ncbi:MAG: phosphatidylglycerol lysyltransferase domain-containing protein [Aridibacter sp.]
MESKSDNKTLNHSSLLLKVRDIILTYGWNSASYQIINPGINYWFSDRNDAVIGFVSCAGVRVVAGAPVCAENRLREVAAEFETDAARMSERVCYLAAESRLEAIYKNHPKYTEVLLGSQPVWQPSKWKEIIAENKSLRAQLNRARNKGVKISEWSTEKARNNPFLIDCLEKWLETKGLPPLGFMVEPHTLSRLFDRRIFVAEIEKEVVGFVMISPIAQRNGWLFEQFVHCPGAPNGTVELMIDSAMRALAEDGFEYATLGLSPLSTNAETAPFRNPLWLRFLLEWTRLHGKQFYNFDGLDAFKAKLKPNSWEPIFALSNEAHLSPRTIYAIAAAFSENKPFRLIFGGLGRALMTETNLLKQKLRRIEK